jgi:type IV secretory pathway VirB9-like protein
MRRLLLLIACTALSTPTFALDKCRPSDTDEQIRVCVYRPMQRYAVNAIVGLPVNLQFGPDERIKRAEPGFTGQDKDGNPTQTWRSGGGTSQPGQPVPIDRFKNNLPIWGFAEGRSSLVVVTTTADGSERSYLFDLDAHKLPTDCPADSSPGCNADPNITAALSFTYPVDVAAAVKQQSAADHQAAVAAWMAKQAKAKEDTAVARLKTDALYGNLNKAYAAKADPQFKMLQPSKVWDNGWLTTFVWPHNVQVPSITMIDPTTGEERVAPTSPSALASQDGQIITVNGTSQWFRLRLGKQAVMDIHNENWSPNRPDSGTGTTSPDAIRTVIQAKQ